MAMYVLYESSSGYGLFEVHGLDEIGQNTEAVRTSVSDLNRFGRVVQLTAFHPFESALGALNQINAVSEAPSFQARLLANAQNNWVPLPENKNKKKKVVDIDANDRSNHLAVVEYVNDIHSYYKEAEKESHPKMYIHLQNEVTEKMRGVLIDWIVRVHMMLDHRHETLYLTVNIVDRFLSQKAVSKSDLQLVGISSMFISSKYEEMRPPKVNDLVYVADHAYNSKQILVMEKTILKNLQWYLSVPTQYVFLVRFIKASMSDDPEMENMVHFLSELGMCHYETLIFSSSMLAASAVYTARCALNLFPTWTDTLKLHTGYKESEIMECSKLLASLHWRCKERSSLGVYLKYSHSKRCCVALVPAAKSLLG